VDDPSGAFEVTQLHAPRLADLHGKTICELSNYSWEADRTLSVIRELLQRQFPTAEIIPYTEFFNTHGPRELEMQNLIPELLHQKGCHAVISGNAA
jgi:hypothetical protein